MYIDGASAGDPGPSGAGVFIKNYGQVERYSIPLGIYSNHEAEYAALVEALKICLQQGYKVISIRTDSQLVDHAIEKQFVRNKKFSPWLKEAMELMDQFELCFVKWIPSKQNNVADELARKAIQMNKG